MCTGMAQLTEISAAVAYCNSCFCLTKYIFIDSEKQKNIYLLFSVLLPELHKADQFG